MEDSVQLVGKAVENGKLTKNVLYSLCKIQKKYTNQEMKKQIYISIKIMDHALEDVAL